MCIKIEAVVYTNISEAEALCIMNEHDKSNIKVCCM